MADIRGWIKAADEARVLRRVREEPLWFYDVLKRWETYEYRSLLLALTRLYEENSIAQNDLGQWKPLS